MDTFLDEMRNQFTANSSQNLIPLSLLAQQNRIQEKQSQMMEQSQKQMCDLMANLQSQAATGGGNPAALRQEIFADNRRMMLEMMSHYQQQAQEMKTLFESTKTCSKDVLTKIDDVMKTLS